ncbi:MAG: VWA domain-containing protein [Candidatus Pacebacteria bacterium]|nr:VWA domain-containing protein [Candidatus Paceibacterota bacterium]
MIKNIFQNKKGFFILYAIIVINVLLIFTIGMVNLSIRERQLVRFGEGSEAAFFAAESGLECALFWDLRGAGVPSAFRYDPLLPSGEEIVCNGQKFQVGDVVPVGVDNVAENSIRVDYSSPENPNNFVDVTVRKEGASGAKTLVDVHGYSGSDTGYSVERGLRVTYGGSIIDHNQQCDAFDFAFVLDDSGSVASNLNSMKNAAKGMVANFSPSHNGHWFSVVSFTSIGHLKIGLTHNKNHIENAIDSLAALGGTNLPWGLKFAKDELVDHGRDEVNNQPVNDIVIVITDGVTNFCIGDPDTISYPTWSCNYYALNNTDNAAWIAATSSKQALAQAEEIAALPATIIVIGVGIGTGNVISEVDIDGITMSFSDYLRDYVATKDAAGNPNYFDVNWGGLEALLASFDCAFFNQAIQDFSRRPI